MSDNPFDWLNSINTSKNYIMEDNLTEKQYSPWMVNRGLSLFVDTIADANEMNMNGVLDNKLQYDFLFHTVRKKKRFSKWPKKIDDPDIQSIMEYYGYSMSKAREVKNVIPPQHLEEIKEYLKLKI